MATINGNDSGNIIVGTNAGDVINAKGGSDIVLGGSGNDTIDGGSGNDLLSGGNGNDTILGGSGTDILSGDNGNDTLDGGSGSDLVAGGNGNDLLIYRVAENAASYDIYDGGSGQDTLRIVVSAAVAGSAAFQNDIAQLRAKLSHGSASDYLESIGLLVTSIERLEVVEEGNLNQAPTDISLTNNTVAENATGAVIGTLSTVDPNAGDTHTYTVSDNRFEVVGGQLKLKAGESLNFEAGSAINVNVTSKDSGNLSITEMFTINVTNVNEAPTDISLVGNTVAENAAGAVVGTLSTVDPDAGASHTYTVSDNRFEVVGNTLKLKDGVSLNYESGSPVSVTVTANDGANNYSEPFTINVTNVNEAPTDISLVGNTVAENAAGAVVGTLSTVDPDAGASHTYTVSDNRFEVVGNTLKLKDGVSLNYESGSPVSVTVTANDGANNYSEPFTINVTNVNEAPTDISLVGDTVAENAPGAVIGTLSTVDPDTGNTHTYAVDDSRFEVVNGVLKLRDDVSLDFEIAPTVDVTVTSTDQGGLPVSETFTIQVTDENDAPTAISLEVNSINENTAGAVVGTLSGTDPDSGDVLTFSIADVGSPFEVVDNLLKLKDGATLDFEDASSVLVTVTATDTSGATFNQGYAISVNDGFEALAVDGYIAGATVFADADGDGVLDAGEVSAITDAYGNFTLFGGSGPLVMFGGTDISTDKPFEGIMRAPEGSTVVTPLTTLVVAIAEATGIDIATATSNLLVGLGLPATIDLSTFDPIAATMSSDPALQQQGAAAIAAAVQVQNTIVQAASLIEGAGASSFAEAAASVVAELAVAINDQATAPIPSTFDLGSGAAVEAIIVNAAQTIIDNAPPNTDTVDPASIAATAAAAANVISSGNAVIEAAGGQTGVELLTTLAQVAIVASDAAAGLSAAGAAPETIATVEASYTGTNLTAAVNAAEDDVGDVVGANADDIVDGTENSDTLQGFGGNDTLSGLGGNDFLDGGDGNDILDGGAGRDRATYAAATGGITVDLAAGAVSGSGIGSDTLQSVEQIRGSNFADTYAATGFGVGSTNASSSGANNVFEGMGGDDVVTGNGSTQVSYQSATGAVTVNLANPGANGQTGTAAGDSSVGNDIFKGGVSGARGSNYDDILIGSAGNDQFTGGGGNDAITGGGGNDRAIYSSFVDDTTTGGVTINMAAGTVTGDVSVGTDTLTSVESIRGSNFADSYVATGFSGSSTNAGSNGTFNEFEGMGGNDTVTGNGNTRIGFFNATASVTVDLANAGANGQTGTASGNASVGNDIIKSGVNSVSGSQFGDTLFGSNNAAGTTEQFDGRDGNDAIDGRGGFDQAAYNIDAALTSGISVSVSGGGATWTVTGVGVGTDTLTAIESIRATNFNDTFVATGFTGTSADTGLPANFNEFEGLGGNDTITGSGNTRLSFVSATAGVTVDFFGGPGVGTVVGGDASVGNDTFTGVGRIRGSNFNDTILGGSGNNILEGQGGNDTINGRAGADTLTGGAGSDTFVYANGNGADTITDFSRAQGDKIDLTGVTGVYEIADLNISGTLITFSAGNTLQVNGPASLLGTDFIFAQNAPPTDISLSNSSVDENSPSGTVVGTFSAVDPNAGDLATFSLLDDASGRFAINGSNLVITGTLDYEAASSYQVTVRVTDSANNTRDEAFTIDVVDLNEAPSVSLSSPVTSIDENSVTGFKVADIVLSDDAQGAPTLTLAGADAASFAIVGNELHYVGASPDFEAKSSYDVVVEANDETIGAPGSIESSQSLALTINDVNEAPSNVSFTNTVTSIDENVNVGGGIKVADIVVTDDVLGFETVTLSGADAGQFAVNLLGELYYIGSSPNYEVKASYSVTVNVNDESLGAPGSIETSQDFTLAVNNLPDSIELSLANQATAINENATVGVGIKVADIVLGNYVPGTESLTLSGADAASFDIVGNELFYVGSSPDFESQASYSVTVNADDTTAGMPGSIEASQSLTLTIGDVNEAPTAVSFANTVTAVNEYVTVPVGGIKVADVLVTDDALGTETLTLSGPDAGSFTISGGALYYTGASPDFETQSSYSVTVNAADTSLGAPAVSQTFVLTINDVTGITVTAPLDTNSNTLTGTPEGNDTVDYSATTLGVNINLAAGTASGPEVGNDTVTGFENAIGGSGNDTIRGHFGDNQLFGGDGDDLMTAGTGTDLFDGGNGLDRVTYEGSATALTIDLAAGTGVVGGFNKTFLSTELIRGTNQNDTFDATGFGAGSTNAGSNGTFNEFEGLGGADTITGNGDTRISYASATAGVVVNFSNHTVTGNASVGADAFTGISSVQGSNFDDTYVFSSGDGDYIITNFVAGPSGVDTIDLSGVPGMWDLAHVLAVATQDGADTVLDFGNGDVLTLNNVTLGSLVPGDFVFTPNQAPTVALANAIASLPENSATPVKVADIVVSDDGFGTNDLSLTGLDAASFEIVGTELYLKAGVTLDFETLSSLQVTVNVDDASVGGPVDGSQSFTLDINDVAGLTLTGDANANTLVGSPEVDTLNGLGGGDTLDGGAGNDILNGGDGNNDVLIGGAGADVLDGGNGNDFASYQTSTSGLTADLQTPANNTGDAIGDTYVSIERLIGSAFNDSLRGDGNGNFLEGGGGADALNGRNGFDYASYIFAAAGVTANLGSPGANTGEAAGDTFTSIEGLAGSAFNDTLIGDGNNNNLRGNAGADVLNGGGGRDTAEYTSSATAVTADLGNAANNTGDAAGDSYISIEDLRGSNNGADTLRGDAGGNFLEGGNGIFADVLDGGANTDFASYESSATAVIASLASPGVNTGDAQGDIYISIEGLQGSNFNDTLTGDANGNFLMGGAGADVLDGGGGADWAEYRNSGIGIVADLSNSSNNTGEAAGDTYNSIENLRGSNFNDTLTGDGNNNFLRGGSGSDVHNGNGGSDTADYFNPNATAGITVDLANAGNNTGEAIGDTYSSIENVRGTALNDTLRGDGNTNLLDGQVGADVLDGSGGNDYAWYNTATTGVTANLANTATNTGDAAGDSYISIEGLFGSAFNDVLTGDANANFLRGGAGADTLEGGAGIDTFVFASVADSPGSGPSDTITDFAEGEDLFDLSIIDASTAVAGNSAFTFGGQDSNVLANSVTWFQDGTNTIVQADTNGDAVADLTITLSGLKTLTGSDFLL